MKTETVYSYKYNQVVGGISFLVLLILSLLFFKERVGLSDTAYHLFTILKNDDFAIQNNRFVAVLTQLFPLLGANLNLSLANVALLYSASFVIVQAAIFFIINKVLQNAGIALAYLFFVTLITAHTFFWVQSELPQGVGFLFIYFALLEHFMAKEKLGIAQIIGLLLLIIIVVFSHPLLLFPFVFFHAFLYRKTRPANTILIALTVAYIIIALGRSVIFRMSYEQSAFSGLKNFIYLFPDYFTIQSNKNFLRYIFSDYYFLIILFVTNVVYYLRQKQLYKLFICAVFFVGFLGLVNVCYHGGANQFYIENQYLLLGVFVIIPLVYDILPTLLPYRSYFFYTIPITVVVVCFIRIVYTTPYYTAKLDWKRQAIENMKDMKDKRVIIKIEQVPIDVYTDTWSAAYEFWFLSTLEYDYSQATLIEVKRAEHDWTWDSYDKFISGMEVTNYADLKPPYFKYASVSAIERYKPLITS